MTKVSNPVSIQLKKKRNLLSPPKLTRRNPLRRPTVISKTEEASIMTVPIIEISAKEVSIKIVKKSEPYRQATSAERSSRILSINSYEGTDLETTAPLQSFSTAVNILRCSLLVNQMQQILSRIHQRIRYDIIGNWFFFFDERWTQWNTIHEINVRSVRRTKFWSTTTRRRVHSLWMHTKHITWSHSMTTNLI